MNERWPRRLGVFALAVGLLALLWRPWPLAQAVGAEPRPVTARGELAADERATIEVFERSRDSVVFISTRQRVRDFWTRNVFSVPRGTGIGFAVPVDTVNRVVPQLIGHGRYIRPTIGIEIDEGLNQRLPRLLNIDGVVVLGVQPGSPAAAASLRGSKIERDQFTPGDIIVAVNGKPVASVGDLLGRLDDHRVGGTVPLTLLRDGRKTEARVTLQPGS
jgi:hypothetical protein